MDDLTAEEKESILQTRRTKQLAEALAIATATVDKATKEQERRDEQARTSAKWVAGGGYNSAHLGISRLELSYDVEQVSSCFSYLYLHLPIPTYTYTYTYLHLPQIPTYLPPHTHLLTPTYLYLPTPTYPPTVTHTYHNLATPI